MGAVCRDTLSRRESGLACSALLLPVFISRAAQRLHVDVVCLSEWDVIYPALALPGSSLRASDPCNMQLCFSLCSPFPSLSYMVIE